jgi:hypothetical protein
MKKKQTEAEKAKIISDFLNSDISFTASLLSDLPADDDVVEDNDALVIVLPHIGAWDEGKTWLEACHLEDVNMNGEEMMTYHSLKSLHDFLTHKEPTNNNLTNDQVIWLGVQKDAGLHEQIALALYAAAQEDKETVELKVAYMSMQIHVQGVVMVYHTFTQLANQDLVNELYEEISADEQTKPIS